MLVSLDGGDNGMISDDATINPDMYNWNKVFINYCDGGSYSGSKVEPVQVGDQTIWYVCDIS